MNFYGMRKVAGQGKIYKYYEHMFIMVRPKICRLVSIDPEVVYFKPRGIPVSDLEEIILTVDELEAIRLKDHEELDQEECAKLMNISRPTFHRVYKNARKKIAEFLLHGKALKIEGGVYILDARVFLCKRCGHRWRVRYGGGRPVNCPECGNDDIHSAHKILRR